MISTPVVVVSQKVLARTVELGPVQIPTCAGTNGGITLLIKITVTIFSEGILFASGSGFVPSVDRSFTVIFKSPLNAEAFACNKYKELN